MSPISPFHDYFQFWTFWWVCWYVNKKHNQPIHAWIRLPHYTYITLNIEADWDETLVWQLGPIRYVRPA